MPLLLLAQSPKSTCSNIWMVVGTVRKICIPVMDVVGSLPCGCLRYLNIYQLSHKEDCRVILKSNYSAGFFSMSFHAQNYKASMY